MPHWPIVGPFGLKEGKAEGESSDSEGDSDDDKKSYKSHSDAEDDGPKTVTFQDMQETRNGVKCCENLF